MKIFLIITFAIANAAIAGIAHQADSSGDTFTVWLCNCILLGIGAFAGLAIALQRPSQ